MIKLYQGLRKVIKLFDDYPGMASEAKYRGKHGKRTQTVNS